MDTKVLRQKVLDLAIRGKLASQDPNNEPAFALLDRIWQQKQQMVKEGKLKAKDIKNDTIIYIGEDNLHYEKFADGSVKCIEDEIPFAVPDGWAWTRLSNLSAGIQRGLHNSAESTGTHKLLRITDIQNGTVDWDTVPFTTTTIPDACLLKCGDIVFARTGTTVGKTFLITETPYPAVCASYLIRIRLLDSLLPEYIYQFLGSVCYWTQIADKTVGVGQPNCNSTSLKALLVPLPPINEQFKIVSTAKVLLECVAKIDAEKNALISILAAAKTKILDLAIRGQLVPQDPADEPASVLLEDIWAEKEALIKQGKIKRDKKESFIFCGEDNAYYEKMADGKLRCLDGKLPFELPAGWAWCNLGMIGFTNIGLKYRPTDVAPDGVIVLRSCNIVNDKIDLGDLVRVKTDIRANQYAGKNDILICVRNGSNALVGKCALIPDLGEATSFGAFMAIYRTPFYEYVLHFLCSGLFRKTFDDGNSAASNQLTQDMLKKAIIPLPPLAEQRRIVSKIDALISKINCIARSFD